METSELTELVRRHQDAVCAVAYAVLRDRARSEEIAQEAFLIAWRDGKAPSAALLCGIARNLARNAARRRKEPTMTDEPSAGDDPRSLLIAREEEAQVRAALDALPERDREAVVLYYRGDESMRDVAGALGITEANARQRVHRGREKLRERLAAVEVSLRAGRPGPAFTGACVAAVIAGMARPSSAAAASGSGAAKLAIAIAAAGCTAGVIGWRVTSSEPVAAAVHVATVDLPEARVARHREVPPPRRPIVVRASTTAASAAAPVTGPLIDLDFAEVPAAALIGMLAAQLEVPIVHDAPLEDPLDIEMRQVPALDVLDLVLDGLDATREDLAAIRVVAGGRTDADGLGDTPVTAHFDHTPIADALAAIALDLPIAVGKDVDATVSLDLDAVPAGVALERVLAQTHLGYEDVTGYRVVATTDPAPAE